MFTLTKEQSRLIEWLCLAAIFLAGFLMTSIPRFDYAYPLHLDEWWHYGDATSLVETGDANYPEPYPQPPDADDVITDDVEIGYHVFLAELKLITDVSWLNLLRFLPGLILGILALMAYFFGKEKGFGLAAAFLVVLIPTTTRFLGPAFTVPVALALVFIPLTLLILNQSMGTVRRLLILFSICLGLLFIHPPTMAIVTGICIIHSLIFLFLRSTSKSRYLLPLLTLVVVAMIYMIMVLWAPSAIEFVLEEASDSERHLTLPPIMNTLSDFGFIPVALFVIGAAILAYKGTRFYWTMLLSIVALLAFIQLYPHYYVGPDIIYERGWLYTYIFMALIGGLALISLGQYAKSALNNNPALASTVQFTAVAFLVIVASAFSLRNHLDEPYYHMIDDTIYKDFLWIEENVPPQYDTCLVDKGMAWAFAPVTGKFGYYAEIAPNPHPEGRSVMEFLQNGLTDTSWLKDRDIDMVYTQGLVQNDDLVEVHNNVYLLME